MCGVITALSSAQRGWAAAAAPRRRRRAPRRRCAARGAPPRSAGLVHHRAPRDVDEPRGRASWPRAAAAPISPRVAVGERHRQHHEVGVARGRGGARPAGRTRWASRAPRPLRLTPTTRIPRARAARAMARPMSPSPTTQRVAPCSRVGFTGRQCRARCWRPEALHLLRGPERPAQRVLGHPRPEDAGARVRTTSAGSPGTRKRSTPAPMLWIQRSRGARPSRSRGKPQA